MQNVTDSASPDLYYKCRIDLINASSVTVTALKRTSSSGPEADQMKITLQKPSNTGGQFWKEFWANIVRFESNYLFCAVQLNEADRPTSLRVGYNWYEVSSVEAT